MGGGPAGCWGPNASQHPPKSSHRLKGSHWDSEPPKKDRDVPYGFWGPEPPQIGLGFPPWVLGVPIASQRPPRRPPYGLQGSPLGSVAPQIPTMGLGVPKGFCSPYVLWGVPLPPKSLLCAMWVPLPPCAPQPSPMCYGGSPRPPQSAPYGPNDPTLPPKPPLWVMGVPPTPPKCPLWSQ